VRPYQDQIVVNDIVLGMLWFHLHERDQLAKARARIAHRDRPMPVGLGHCAVGVEQRIAQEVMRIKHKLWLSGGIDEDDSFFSGGIKAA
jgi:hypothetical protein